MVRKRVICEQSGKIMDKTVVAHETIRSLSVASRPKKGLFLCALAGVLALSLGGCGMFDDTPSQGPPPRKAKVEKEAKVQAETELKPIAVGGDYQRPEYPGRRRNPFQPDPDVFQPAQTAIVGEIRPLEPLEEFSLSQLTLVALISETSIPMAMFVDSEGLGHVVKEGDRIGRNGGVIVSIRDNEVEVREGSEDVEQFGGSVTTLRLRDLELATGDGEGLSAQDRLTLERLLQSEQGRQAIEELRGGEQQSAGESPAPGVSSSRPQGDARFQGTAPPR